MKHNQALSSSIIGILVMISIFLQYAPARADSGKQQLRTWMHENKVVTRLVKLDRQDGFMYGLSIKGDSLPEIVIAPGWQRGWLVQVDGEEALLQPDAAGSLQVIAQTDNFIIWVCYLKQITTFLSSALACITPPVALCYTDNFLTLIINLNSCKPASSSFSISGGS